MNDDAKTTEHRRLVDRIGDAMDHAINNGREEFGAKLGSIRDLVVEAEIAECAVRRINDELDDWIERRYA